MDIRISNVVDVANGKGYASSKLPPTLQHKIIDAELQKFDFIDQLLLYGQIIGFVLSIYGFLLWYYRLQRYQDELIRIKAQQLNKLHESSKKHGVRG
jgi:hypothetical protein